MNLACEKVARIHLFVDGELSTPEADEVRTHLVDCTACERALDEVLQLDALVQTSYPLRKAPEVDEVPERVPEQVIALSAARKKRFQRLGRWAGGVSAIAAAALVMLMVRPGINTDPYGLGDARPLEVRLTHPGASEYRRYQVVRSGEAHFSAVPLETLARMEKKGDADGLATGYLLRGEKAQAAQTLAQAKSSPDVDSDRAVAALLSGDDEGALTLVDGVLRASPSHPAALWNRGLVLRDLGLLLAAAEAFDQVAAKREPGWAEEAEQRAAELRRELDDRDATWKAADAAGRELMLKHVLPAEALVQAEPGLFRLYFYDAVRTASDAAMVNSLRRLAAQLDGIAGGQAQGQVPVQVLAQLVDRVAKADFTARKPLASEYPALANGQLDASHTARLLARSGEQTGQPDLRMGILLQAHALDSNLDEYEKLAAESRDPWFIAIAEQTHAASLKQQAPLRSEQILRAAIDQAQAARLDYRELPLRLALGELLANTFQRVPEAFAQAQAAMRLAKASGNLGREQTALFDLANDARLRWAFALARAYLREATLRLSRFPENCDAQSFAHESLANMALLESRPDEARRELDAESSCQRLGDLQGALVFAELARSSGGRAEDVAKLEGMLKLLRESGTLSPGELALTDATVGRMRLERADPSAAALLEKAIAEAEAQPSSDAPAQNARAYAFVALELSAARAGRFDEALSLLAKEERAVPSACMLGVGADDSSSFILVKGASGEMVGSFDAQRIERLDQFVPKPGPLQLAALRGCAEISVLARPPLQGRTGILPPEMAWSYGAANQAASPAQLSRKKRLIVADAEPPGSLGLPRLGSWVPAASQAVHSDVAQPLPDEVELRGSQATPSRVLAEMESATEIDIDAHGLVDLALSDASLIALTPDADGTWALSAAQVKSHRLLGRPLVILAACRAAVGVPLLYAPWSLPAAFLQAGAGAVFASRDDIPDAQARDFFDAVLADVRSGKSERTALRDARMSFRSKPGGAWVDSVLLFE